MGHLRSKSFAQCSYQGNWVKARRKRNQGLSLSTFLEPRPARFSGGAQHRGLFPRGRKKGTGSKEHRALSFHHVPHAAQTLRYPPRCAHRLLHRLKIRDEPAYPISSPALRHPVTALRHHAAPLRPRFRPELATGSHIDTKICPFCRPVVLVLRASKSCPGRTGKFAKISAPSLENASFFVDVA